MPTIGIGAGPHTSGQVLVYHDLLGMMHHPHHAQHVPSFCKRYATVGENINGNGSSNGSGSGSGAVTRNAECCNDSIIASAFCLGIDFSVLVAACFVGILVNGTVTTTIITTTTTTTTAAAP